MRTLVPEFCSACGDKYESPDCSVSHDTTSPSQDTGIGQIVTYRRALRRRTGVVVGGTAASPVVIESTGGDQRIPNKVVEVNDAGDWMAVPSPLYRLEVLAKTVSWNGVLTPWLDENRQDLLKTIGDRRLLAMAAAGAGDLDIARTSGLSASEISWLTMHVQRDSGDLSGAFHTALSLEPATYPDHALILLEALGTHSELLNEPKLADHVRGLDRGYTGWAALTAAIDGTTAAESGAVTEELELLGDRQTAGHVRSVVAGTDAVEANAWVRASTGASLSPSDLAAISGEHPAVADDAIDAGRVEASSVSDIESAYLRARISLKDVTDGELRPLGAIAELARRSYVSEDSEALTQLIDEAPSEVGYYIALDALRRGEVPDEVPDDDILKAVVASIRSERAHPNALADPSTWSVLSQLITDEDAEDYPQQAAIWQLERARADLATWDFESALSRARLALRWSDDEAIRDEALNIVGFVLYQQGNDEPAINALEKALEGDYSANLQANIGIIAEELQPEIAAHHLGQLADDAPTLDLRLAAVRRAFGIWTKSADAWDEDELVMPENLLSTFRTLVVAEIPYDDYISLVQLLSRADAKWLANQSNSQTGPHVGSAARRVYTAKASQEPGDYVEALAAESERGNDEEWYVEEKNNLVESLRSLIFSEDGSIGPASYAFAAIDAGLELDDFDYVTLASGAAISILGAIAEDDGLPSDKIRGMISTAKKRVQLLDEEQRELVEPLVSSAGDRYGAVVASFHAGVHDQIIEALQAMGNQMYGMQRRRINWTVVVDAVSPMRRQLKESAYEVETANTFVSDEALAESLRGLASGLRELADKLGNPRRFFS